MNAKDPKGYYAILQVEPTSSAPQIKAAYKRRAMELHPDRNSAPSATRDFQLLTEAHRILTNPAARASYDTSAVATDTVGTRASVPEPIVCSACGKVTAQPRYVIFYYVISFILVTTRTPVQGIFCSRCAEWKGLRATVITWLFGWWGFPWGPFYSLDAILKNLVGGTKPYEINARLAAHQAMVFAVLGKMQVARAIALDAAALARKVKPKNLSVRLRRLFGKEVDDDGSRLRKEIADLLASLSGSDNTKRLKNTWSLFRRPFYSQLSILVVAVVCVSVFINLHANDASTTNHASVTDSDNYVTTAIPKQPDRPQYVRPAAAPNGQAWPTDAAYISGYPQLRTNGISDVTVDNGQDSSDVFVKLFSLDGSKPKPVRTLYIPAHGLFTIHEIGPGNYDVRYRDLASGYIFKTDSFVIEQMHTTNGIRYSDFTMTLYKVRNGNMQTYEISPADF